MMTRRNKPDHVLVALGGKTYYADTVKRTACYAGDLCKFEEAWWFDGSPAAVQRAAMLTADCLRAADRIMAK